MCLIVCSFIYLLFCLFIHLKMTRLCPQFQTPAHYQWCTQTSRYLCRPKGLIERTEGVISRREDRGEHTYPECFQKREFWNLISPRKTSGFNHSHHWTELDLPIEYIRPKNTFKHPVTSGFAFPLCHFCLCFTFLSHLSLFYFFCKMIIWPCSTTIFEKQLIKWQFATQKFQCQNSNVSKHC